MKIAKRFTLKSYKDIEIKKYENRIYDNEVGIYHHNEGIRSLKGDIKLCKKRIKEFKEMKV